ncbi:MAG: low molecular weight protein-tyrosine-phosphatase Wzb [Enterobacter asburiae]|nr:low molecular weight protein-tyrosine-phosphatase Wzb [Enterobacter asburiae]
MFNKILVVCVGNICRSPTAERLLKHYQPELTVDSAGLGALVGKGADERAMARQVTGRMCREYDLILTMEKRHIHALCDIAPEMRGKVMLFGHWDNEREIPDPYRKSHEAFEAVYTLLDQSAQQWAQALKVQQG